MNHLSSNATGTEVRDAMLPAPTQYRFPVLFLLLFLPALCGPELLAQEARQEETAVFVQSLIPGGLVERAEIQPGDVLLSVEDRPIRTKRDFKLIAEKYHLDAPGPELDTKSFEVVLRRLRDDGTAAEVNVAMQYWTLSELGETLTEGIPPGPGEEPALFVHVVPSGSTLEKAGVQAGDILLSWAGKKLRHPGDLYRIAGELCNAGTHPLVVRRLKPDGSSEETTLSLDAEPSYYPLAWGFPTPREPAEEPSPGTGPERAADTFVPGGTETLLPESRAETLEEYEEALAAAEHSSDPRLSHQALVELRGVHYLLEQWEKVLEDDRRLLQLAEQMKDGRLRAGYLSSLASTCRILGRCEESLEYLNRALRLYEEAGELREVASTYGLIAGACIDLLRYPEALDAFKAELEILLELEDRASESNTRGMIGMFYESLGWFVHALDQYERSYELSRSLAGESKPVKTLAREQEVTMLSQMGSVLARMGLPERALRRYEQALQVIHEEKKDPAFPAYQQVSILRSIGSLYQRFGEYDKALEYKREAHGLRIRQGGEEDRLEQAVYETELGALRAAQGDPAGALEHYQRAQEVYEQRGLGELTLQPLARVKRRLGRFAEALNELERAIRAVRDMGRPTASAEWERALVFYPEKGKPKAYSHPGRFLALLAGVVSEVREKMRRAGPGPVVQEWLPRLERAVEVAWRAAVGQPSAPAPLVSVDGDWGDTLTSVRQECEASPFEGWAFVDVGFHLVETLRAQGFLLEMNKRARDIEKGVAPELIRARNKAEGRLNSLRQRLLAVVSGRAAHDERGHPLTAEQRKATSRSLRNRIAEAVLERERAERAIALANPPLGALRVRNPVTLKAVQDTLGQDELFLEYVLTGQEGLKWRVSGETLRQVEEKPSGAAYLLAVSHEGAGVFRVGETKELANRVERLRVLLEAQAFSGKTKAFARQAQALYNELIRPALDAFGTAGLRHLVLSPDGPLARLPFDSLLSEAPGKDATFQQLPYLSRRFSTELTPSGTAWVDTRRGAFRRGEPGEAFVALADPYYGKGVDAARLRSVGTLPLLLPEELGEQEREAAEHRRALLAQLPPELREGLEESRSGAVRGSLLRALPGTRAEVAAIAPLFEPGWEQGRAITSGEPCKDPAGKAKVFLGKGAREFRAKQERLLESAQVLHFACHGVADDRKPADAAVILTTEELAEEEDGFLTAAEVMGLRTNARVVTLSACETGLGKLLRGEGVQGLSRAWQFTGARTVVVSLWKVDDRATTEFMKTFYAALERDGLTVTAALAAARRALAASEEFAAPYYWAAFVAHGER